MWQAPTFVKLSTHKLPNGKTIRRKAGTQIVDRAWRFIKDRLHLRQAATVGSTILRTQIRGAQYEHWKRDKDMWLCIGDLLTWYLQTIFVYIVSHRHATGKNCQSLFGGWHIYVYIYDICLNICNIYIHSPFSGTSKANQISIGCLFESTRSPWTHRCSRVVDHLSHPHGVVLIWTCQVARALTRGGKPRIFPNMSRIAAALQLRQAYLVQR